MHVLSHYSVDLSSTAVKPFGNGLINHTWLIDTPTEQFILQRLNERIFKSPDDIASNIEAIRDFLERKHPSYHFVAPIKNKRGATLTHVEEGYFRLFPFVKHSISRNVVDSPKQAFEAASQFGKFTTILHDFPVEQLKITLPDFHNLTLRHQQFVTSQHQGNPERIQQAQHLIEALNNREDILKTFEAIQRDTQFKLRVTHHDTKISNVLFNANDDGLCVIDLDTVMPGYFISDVGDMMRTYLSPVSEEEKDFNLIEIREPFLEAVVKGYYRETQSTLSTIEKEHFFFAGRFMIYMQALRFLTDYINDDQYYPITYSTQNFVRAGNQLSLLIKLESKSAMIHRMLDNISQ
ncbi:aminoglycoside phosphotransferase family protein [Pseudochryseolinea flava]|uniref:Aminoglycoside phosphotransferase family protein n=1 Tax=Pseudochryseolinea flava TaxID=2059302 RepID=A0A364Y614_9BACT|nr:aminoglycoside phosphotransferase family protein [Pseudochryseolinea flava]